MRAAATAVDLALLPSLQDMSASQEVGASGSVVLRSSRQLFIDARNAVTRCAKLNAGQTLFSLYKEIQMAVDGYIDALARRLPQPAAPAPGAPTGAAKLYPVSEETAGTTVEAICMTISTAGACVRRSGEEGVGFTLSGSVRAPLA